MPTNPVVTLVGDDGKAFGPTNPLPTATGAAAAASSLVESTAALTANGNTADLALGSAAGLTLLVVVTAAPGGTAPTLQVFLEAKTSAGAYATLGQTASLTAAGSAVVTFTGPLPASGRVRWVVGGTAPSFPADIQLLAR